MHFRLFPQSLWCRAPSLFFCMWVSSCPSTICCRDWSSPVEWSWYCCWKLVAHSCVRLFLTLQFYSLGLYGYPVPHWFDYCSFVVSFWNQEVRVLSFVLFQHCFGCLWNPLPHEFEFCIELRLVLPQQQKRFIGILIGNVLNLYVNGFG